ncbi:MAG: signal peptidase I [Coprobacillus sp.]
MKKINRLASLLFILLLIIIIPLSVPRFFGFSIYNVLSDSMEPSISTGSIVYIKPVNIEMIKENDIVSFYSQANKVVTHRITKIEDNLLTTKGDHNQDIDISKVNILNVIGKVTFSIPFWGYINDFLSNIGGMTGLFIVLVFIMLLWLWCYYAEKKKSA